MIQQSTAPVAANWLSVPGKSSDYGPGISIVHCVVSFFKALHPDYASGSIQIELPALCADPPEIDCDSVLRRTELAARMICVCIVLPATVVSCIGGVANFSAVARWFGSNLAALGADNVASRDDVNQSPARKKQRHKTCHQSARLPGTAIGLGALSSLTAAAAIPASDSKTVRWIEVADAETLGKIGRDPAYPLDGHYRQFADIDAGNLSGPIGNTSHPFVGKYDGRCQSIDKLRHCFVQRLGDNGRIDNVRFVRADISSRERAGVVACKLTDGATLGNIVVEHSTVVTNGTNAPAGIGAGAVYGHSRIDGFSTFNCTTKTTGRNSGAGAVAGVVVVGGLINNARLDSTSVETFHDDSHAGGGAGKLDGMIDNTVMIDSKIVTHGTEANAGGAAGKAFAGAYIGNTVLASTDLITNNDLSCAAGGAGEAEVVTTIANTLLVHSNLQTHGHRAYAAGGGGRVSGRIINTTMVYGRAETSGWEAHAAVGAGFLLHWGRVYNSTGRQVLIRTAGRDSYGAVGAARASGEVAGVVCFGSNVTTTKSYSGAGIGAGKLSGHAVGVVAYDCRVGATGRHSVAGFGSGLISPEGSVLNLTVMHSRAYASDDGAYINGGASPFVCSSSVGDDNGFRPCCNNSTEKSCLPIPEDACKLADRRVLTRDCQPVAPPYYDAEKDYDFACPALPTPGAGAITTLSSTNRSSTPTTISVSTPTTAIATTPQTTSQEPYVLTTPTLPVANATSVAIVNMTNSTMPSLIPATTPVPLVLTAPVAAMSTGALVGGIVAGVVALGLVGVAGFAFYRYSRQQSSEAEEIIRFTDLADP